MAGIDYGIKDLAKGNAVIPVIIVIKCRVETETVMNPDLNTVLDAAMKLPINERRELINRLKLSSISPKTPGSVRKHFGAINSGDPRSADNDKIDTDLAREYSDTHELEN